MVLHGCHEHLLLAPAPAPAPAAPPAPAPAAPAPAPASAAPDLVLCATLSLAALPPAVQALLLVLHFLPALVLALIARHLYLLHGWCPHLAALQRWWLAQC